MQEIGCSDSVRHVSDVHSLFLLVSSKKCKKSCNLLFETQPAYVFLNVSQFLHNLEKTCSKTTPCFGTSNGKSISPCVVSILNNLKSIFVLRIQLMSIKVIMTKYNTYERP